MKDNNRFRITQKQIGASEDIAEEFIVRTENLGKHVATADGRLDILTAVDLSIKPGETLAIVGTSGSGKSTLLGLLAGLDLPSSGRVWLAGSCLTDLNEDGRAALRSEYVGFVFQSFQLLPNLTALENVMLPVELAGAGDEARRRSLAMLDRVGLNHRFKHYPRQLSGGEQQRVALARAFVTEPKILFADEPTGNLDSNTGRTIIELLFELNREKGTTLVLVTHDETLASRCERVIRLDGGRIVSQ
ncbi:ABC transporter ATP-binding protein [Methylocaldum sp.]|uniref:ABC transporter ATP-binding protein n=1 Tax=Methylocaldum sp. TaxID=1969727 RepID=UPI002D710876|nr:ABC transporter ATP-binding protein [Methylocaldum sp.]HYE35177.1 ABC transporter ATP-binding protein [Methylocaldum sp.]